MVTVQFTPDQISKGVETVEQMLGMLKAFASMTSSKYDDDVVNAIQAFVSTVKPYAREEWFVSLLSLLQGLFERKGAKAVLEHLRSM